jgi:hypothetical protein
MTPARLTARAVRRLADLADMPDKPRDRTPGDAAWLDLCERVYRLYGPRVTADDLALMCTPALTLCRSGLPGWLITTEPGIPGTVVPILIFDAPATDAAVFWISPIYQGGI